MDQPHEIAQLTLYLAKPGVTLESLLDKDEPLNSRSDLREITFEVDDVACQLYYFTSSSTRSNPPWLDFLNDQLAARNRISFTSSSSSPNGILFLEVQDRIFIATFGRSSMTHIDRRLLEPEFGIRVAMNMCGNEMVRQTRTESNAITTTHIDRQVTRPSDTFAFGLSEAEDLRYISAHLKDEKEVTLQGRDSLTIKMLGQKRLTWTSLIAKCREFLEQFSLEDYVENFPNFRNFKPAGEEEESLLNDFLIETIRGGDFAYLDLCIPEVTSEDDYAFSFTARRKSDNELFSYLDAEKLRQFVKGVDELSVDYLMKHKIYAYSYQDDRVLENKHWSIYSCIVFEARLESEDGTEDNFILVAGQWKKVERSFYAEIQTFISSTLVVKDPEPHFKGFSIGDERGLKNEESIFNKRVVEVSPTSILFDRAKLRIGTGKKDKEFCDILDLVRSKSQGDEEVLRVRIINSKQYKDASSTNYLFSQAKFYCEAFLTDDTFLREIRSHIDASSSAWKDQYLKYIKDDVSLNNGSHYTLCLWLLYDETKDAPQAINMPLLAQYELKLMHDHLRRVMKLSDIVLRFIPVQLVSGSKVKKGLAARDGAIQN